MGSGHIGSFDRRKCKGPFTLPGGLDLLGAGIEASTTLRGQRIQSAAY